MTREIRAAWIAMVVGSSLSGVAYAGAGVWTTGGPYGSDVLVLATSPVSPGTIYAGTRRRGVYKSTDSGSTWAHASAGLSAPPVASYIRMLVLDPANPARLYALTWARVYKSTDAGGSWAPANVGLSSNVQCLAIDPLSPTTLYASTDGASGGSTLFKSTDAGASWLRAATGLPLAQGVEAVAVHPSTPGTLYATVTNVGLFKSTDAGGSWLPVGVTGQAQGIYFDPTNPATMYVGLAGTLLRSTDSGGTWAPSGLTQVSLLAIAPTSPSTLYGKLPPGTGGVGLVRSTNSGATWTPIDTGLGPGPAAGPSVYGFAIDPTSPATLYAGVADDVGGGGIFRSTNSGDTWTSTGNTGLADRLVFGLASGAPATLYAGTPHGALKSTNSGGSWAQLGLSGYIYSLAVDPVSPATVYAGADTGTFRSTDAGGTWVFRPGLTGPVRILAIDPVTTTTLYAGYAGPIGFPGGGVSKSTDSGSTWAGVGGLPSVTPSVLAIDPLSPGTVYAGCGGGGYKSTDGGGTWLGLGLPTNLADLEIDPTDPATLYATSGRAPLAGLYKSTNAGGSWASANTGLPAQGTGSLALDPTNPATIYVGTFDASGEDVGRVFRTTDAGGSWTPFDRGLPGLPVDLLQLAPTDGPTLYGAVRYGSVWQISAPGVKGDLNGDGRPDLVFRSNADGVQNKAWFMDGVTRSAEAAIAPDAASADWLVRGVDDFNVDGQSDLVFWNQATGTVEFWMLNGTSRMGPAVPVAGAPTLPTNWDLSATADFNHDGRPDMLWRNFSSQNMVIWTMNGTTKLSAIIPNPAQAVNFNWIIVAASDYNADGNTDLLWYNFTSGRIVTWYMDAGVQRISGQFVNPPNAGNNNWKVLASGDYSAQYAPGTPPLGSPDIVWRNLSSGNQVVWHLDFNSTRVFGQFTNPPANTPALDWTIVGPR